MLPNPGVRRNSSYVTSNNFFDENNVTTHVATCASSELKTTARHLAVDIEWWRGSDWRLELIKAGITPKIHLTMIIG